MKRTHLLLLVLTLASSPALAVKKTRPAVSRAQAQKTALAAAPGAAVKSAELEKEEGKLVWSFDLKTKDGIREVWVDAKDGAIVKNVAETAADEAQEKKQEDEKKEEAAGKAKP